MNRFSVYNREEKTVLGLIKKIGKELDELKELDTNQEVVDARGEYNKLDERLESVDNRLESIDNIGLCISSYPRLENETDDTLRIQRLINDAKNLNRKVVFEENVTYYCSDTITIDLSYLDIDFNSSKLDFSNMENKIAIRIDGSKVPPYNNNHIGKIKNLELVSILENNNTGIYFKSEYENSGVSHIDLEKITIHGFSRGVEYSDHAYLIRHYSVDIYNCNICLYMGGTGFDYGENISFYGCAFYNSTTAVYNNNSNGGFMFTQCSFDYNLTSFNCERGCMFLNNCWIEGGGRILISSNDGAYITIDNSMVIMLDNPDGLVPFDVDGKLVFNNCFVSGFHCNELFRELNEGIGLVQFNNSKSYGVCDLFNQRLGINSVTLSKYFDVESINGTKEQATPHIRQNAHVTFDTEVKETGDCSVKLRKEFGVGSNSAFRFFLPIKSERFGVRIRVKSEQELSGVPFKISYVACNQKALHIESTTNPGLWYSKNVYAQSQEKGVNNYDLHTSWHWVEMFTSDSKLPKWANGIVIDIDLFNYDMSNKSIYVDRIELYEY